MPPFDHGEIPAEIVGRYTFEVFDKDSVIDLKSDGTYELGAGPIAFGVFTVQITGEYGVFGDEMRFGNRGRPRRLRQPCLHYRRRGLYLVV